MSETNPKKLFILMFKYYETLKEKQTKKTKV